MPETTEHVPLPTLEEILGQRAVNSIKQIHKDSTYDSRIVLLTKIIERSNAESNSRIEQVIRTYAILIELLSL